MKYSNVLYYETVTLTTLYLQKLVSQGATPISLSPSAKCEVQTLILMLVVIFSLSEVDRPSPYVTIIMQEISSMHHLYTYAYGLKLLL